MNKTVLRNCCTVIVYLGFLHILCSTLHSQFTSLGSDQRRQLRFPTPGLGVVPPYNSGMTLDCMVGYIVADSLARTKTVDDVISYFSNVGLDTLKLAARFNFGMTDYSPVLLRRYLHSTSDSNDINKYWSYPANSIFGIRDVFFEKRNTLGKDFSMLICSDYVLKVVVDSVITGLDSTYGDTIPWVNVNCNILRRFKGQDGPNNCQTDDMRDNGKDIKLQYNINTCLNYGHPQLWQTNTGMSRLRVSTEATGEIVTPVKGDTLYLFLDVMAYDRYTCVLYPARVHELNGGIYKLQNNGNILDPSKVWSTTGLLTASEFESKILSEINIIKSWWIH
ncbi:MAG: hypothetical protein JNJ85_06660 [Candidatus Kapabacteria bacterium]|nr:hypothetical protein [Candidatus Kapabacteria bacterium]